MKFLRPIKERSMRTWKDQQGKIGWAILWLLGVPLPILFVLYVLRGCQ
jgi:hypothetical protein